MSDYSSPAERDIFNEKIYELINDYIEDSEAYTPDMVLAIQSSSNELKMCSMYEIEVGWDVYEIESLIRVDESGTGKEVDIDATFDIASRYFFVI